MDHVPVLPQATLAKHTSPPAQAATARAAMPLAGTEAERVAAALMERCPGALVWFGSRTCRWWAFAKLGGSWTLLETQTVEEMSRALMASDAQGPAWSIA